MTATVLFCFKGRHGLGHTRRTLLVAEATARLDPSLRIVLVSQCRSVELLRRSPFPAVNLPVLDRLPDDAIEAAYLDLLRALGDRLSPSLVVEDTYPDPRHLFLAPFRDTPRALVTSGLTRGAYLERLRQEGLLRQYDRILVARDEAPVVGAADLTPATRTMLCHSRRIRFCGPVFARPSAGEVAAAAAAYAPDGVPLVVVSAGAGGDVTSQAYPERLFRSMTEVAARLLDGGVPARVVLVAGPYYRGTRPRPLPNTTVVPFAADLPALLHAARVAVIRPGSNVLRETLSGPASAVVVPNFSWAEDQQALADRLTGSVPQVEQAGCDDVDRLYRLTRAGLDQPPRPPWAEAGEPAADRIAAELLSVLRTAPAPEPNLFLLAGGLDSLERRGIAARHLPGVPHAGDDPRLLLLDRVPPPHESPAVLHDRGVRLVLIPAGRDDDPRHGVNYDPGYGYDLPVWRRTHRLADHGVLGIDVHHVRAAPARPGAVGYRLARLRGADALPAVWLDLRAVPTVRLAGYAAEVAAALAADGARLADAGDLLDRQVAAQLM
jgi:predicted glycosyltransferase